MRIIRRPKPLAAWIAIIALLGSMITGVVAPTKSVQMVDELLGSVVICTSHGAQSLSQGGDDSAPQSPMNHCPLCTLLAAFTLVGAVLILAFTLELPRVRKLVGASPRTLADHLCLGGIHSRAPPLSA